MGEPILVQPTGPMGWMPPETVDSLVEDLRAEGLDARIAYDEVPGGGMEPVEVVFIWVSVEASRAVINQVVELGARWIERRFLEDPEDPRLKGAHILLYDGDEGRISEIVEAKSADEEPVRRSPEDFERYTQKKPSEGVRRWRGR
jgi:predicted urease superfamily metal-dependent hydrolase